MNDKQKYAILNGVDADQEANIFDQVNLYKCKVGAGTKIDAFVYIEEDVIVGKNCTIRPFTFIPTGVNIGDNVFIGPGTVFTNDMYPAVDGEWKLEEIHISDNASIGAGATILPGITVGENALVGAGSVVIDDVPPEKIVAGNPAEIIGER